MDASAGAPAAQISSPIRVLTGMEASLEAAVCIEHILQRIQLQSQLAYRVLVVLLALVR